MLNDEQFIHGEVQRLLSLLEKNNLDASTRVQLSKNVRYYMRRLSSLQAETKLQDDTVAKLVSDGLRKKVIHEIKI